MDFEEGRSRIKMRFQRSRDGNWRKELTHKMAYVSQISLPQAMVVELENIE